MVDKIDLRKQSSVPPGVPIKTMEINMPGIRGTLPAPAGIITGGTSDIPAHIIKAAKEIQDHIPDIPDEIKKKGGVKPEIIKLSDLDDKKQEEITKSMESMAKSLPIPKTTKPARFMPAGPGIAQAKAMADKMVAEEEKKETTAKEQPKAAPPTPPPVETPPISTVSNCVHCGWPVDSRDLTNPTRLDKQTFVASILGQKRFVKEYDLLGGKLRVIFRALTAEEHDLVIRQLLHDWNAQKLSGPAHSVAEATRYQMALSIESVETDVGPIKLPTLDSGEYDYDEPVEGTILPIIVSYVYKTAMPSESMRRMISKSYGHFVDTLSKLEAMAENSDFWTATGD